MDLVHVVSSHHERAVVRVGDVFVKVETDPERAARELNALASVDVVAVPRVLWSQEGPPHVLALSAITGTQLATLGQPSPFGDDAWRAAAGAAPSAAARTRPAVTRVPGSMRGATSPQPRPQQPGHSSKEARR